MADVDSLAAHRHAIESTIPLLDAMQSIAEMALRLAQRAVVPLATYAEEVSTMLSSLAATLDPTLQAEAFAGIIGAGPPAVLLIGSERGLCGALNERLVRQAGPLLRPDTRLICWGSRAASVARSARHQVDLAVRLPSLRIPWYAEVESMTLVLLEFVEQHNVSRLDVVYDAPVHGFQYAFVKEQILPPRSLSSSASRECRTEVKPADDLSSLLIQLVSEQVLTGLYRVVILAAVSEQLARVAAMRLASDNAHRLFDELTTQYNVARQHAITQSLLEIISGYQTTMESPATSVSVPD